MAYHYYWVQFDSEQRRLLAACSADDAYQAARQESRRGVVGVQRAWTY